MTSSEVVFTEAKKTIFCSYSIFSGSDAASTQCRATLSPDGKHYLLNGNNVIIVLHTHLKLI